MWGQRCTVLLMHFSFYYLTVAFTTYDFSATSLKNNNNQTSTAIYLLVFSAYWKEMEVTHTNTHTHGAPYEHERSRNLHLTELKLIHLSVGVLLWGILSAHLFCSGAFSVHTCSALGHSQCTLVLLWGILSAHLFCSGAFSVHTCSALGHSQCTLVLLWGILSAHLFCSGAFSVHTCSALGHSQCTLVLSVVRSTASPNTDHVSSTMSVPHSSGAAVLKQICMPGRNG